MIDSMATHGNAYCSDPDYATFLGPQRTRIYYDWGLRAYVRATIQEPKTPQDRVTPATLDDLGDDEAVALGIRPKPPRMGHGYKDVLAAECAELLRERPMTSNEMADALGYPRPSVAKFFYQGPNGFVRFGHTSTGAALWGVEGVEYGKVYTGAMVQILDFLREVGTATAREIYEGAGITDGTFVKARRFYPNALRVVEVRKVGKTMVNVWGINE